jgi:hypothetical protein
MYQRPSEPLSIGGVLDNGIQLFKASVAKTFPLALAGGLISTLPQIFTQVTGLGPYETALLGDSVGTILGVVLITSLLAMAAYLAVLSIQDAISNNRIMAIDEAVLAGLTRLPAMLGASILYGLAIGLGLVLLIVPGIILSVYWILFTIAVISDRKGPVQSLGYSYQLIKGHWWRSATILGVLGIIAMVLYAALIMLVAGGAIGGAIGNEDSAGLLIFSSLTTALVSAAVTPLFYAILLVMYNDLKLRRGGDDLLRRAESSVSA